MVYKYKLQKHSSCIRGRLLRGKGEEGKTRVEELGGAQDRLRVEETCLRGRHGSWARANGLPRSSGTQKKEPWEGGAEAV